MRAADEVPVRDFRDLPERTRIVLLLTLALPLAVAIVAASMRYGSELRRAAEIRAIAVGDSLLTGSSPAEPEGVLKAAEVRGYDAVLYQRTGDALERSPAQPAGLGAAWLDRRSAARLLARARGVAVRPQGGRTSVLVPVRAEESGEITGALLLVHRSAVPPALPQLPLLAGLPLLVLTLLAAAAWARRPAAGRAVLVFVPPAAFGALLIAVLPAPAEAGGYRFWTAVYLGAWGVLAAAGLGMVRASERGGLR